jgi:hypothetical protein
MIYEYLQNLGANKEPVQLSLMQIANLVLFHILFSAYYVYRF